MAILYGTTGDGTTLPVLVDQFGNLLAKGIDGAEGPEGPEGPPGPEGPEGDPGVGVPLPYGEEGSYLGIIDGVPKWNVPDIPPGPEPEPTPTIELLTTPDLYPGSNYSLALRNDQFVVIDPSNAWNQMIRTFSNWESPRTINKTGVGIMINGREFKVKMVLDNALGTILHIHSVFSWLNNGSKDRDWTIRTTVNNDQVVPIKNTSTFYSPKLSTATGRNDATFLLNRDKLGEVEVTFDVPTAQGIADGYGDLNFYVLKKFNYEDPTSYLLNRQIDQIAKIETLSTQLRELRKS